ncbi:MAG: hypothetical protein LLG20_23855, partial [Acidobacteriales bacterium]|nr:hypothetical protein [Terriglobales bacterium]
HDPREESERQTERGEPHYSFLRLRQAETITQIPALAAKMYPNSANKGKAELLVLLPATKTIGELLMSVLPA